MPSEVYFSPPKWVFARDAGKVEVSVAQNALKDISNSDLLALWRKLTCEVPPLAAGEAEVELEFQLTDENKAGNR